MRFELIVLSLLWGSTSKRMYFRNVLLCNLCILFSFVGEMCDFSRPNCRLFRSQLAGYNFCCFVFILSHYFCCNIVIVITNALLYYYSCCCCSCHYISLMMLLCCLRICKRKGCHPYCTHLQCSR